MYTYAIAQALVESYTTAQDRADRLRLSATHYALLGHDTIVEEARNAEYLARRTAIRQRRAARDLLDS